MKNNFKVIVLGAGSGGISSAAKLAGQIGAENIAIVDPADKHYYQPLWTLAGAGIVPKEETEKSQSSVMPSGVTWFKESVEKVDPIAKTVTCSHGVVLNYEFLIVATGLVLNWDKIEGLKGNLGKNGICTIYQFDQVDYTAELINNFKGGKAVFVMPPPPIKCAGAPQKIMYLAENIFRNNGVRHKSEIYFATPGKAMFGVPVFAEALGKIVKEKEITPKYLHKIVGVDAQKKLAFFDVTDAEGKVSRQSLEYDLLHIVPTMSAHEYVTTSGLACTEGDQKGWLSVDKYTLQHTQFSNIFGVGDVTGVPNSKTGAAVRKQYPIVVENLINVMQGRAPAAKYDGYASCPLITEIGKVMLAEFGYDGKLLPTFPLDPTIPRRSYWYLKKELLPKLYWWGMLKGIG